MSHKIAYVVLAGTLPAPLALTLKGASLFPVTEHLGKDALLYDADGNHTRARSQMSWRHVLAEVRIYDGESIESALRRFKRQVQQEGILKEVKRHSVFLKPGEKKRLKSKLAQKLKRKKVRRQPPDTDSKTSARTLS